MNRIKTLLSTLATAAVLAFAPMVHAAGAIDTGTPDGSGGFPLAFDSWDWVAGQVSFANATTLSGIQGHILGGTAGETFDISLFAAGNSPSGSPLFTTTATYGADGWNGASGLAWNVAAGTYWIEFEIQGDDTLGTFDLPVFDLGAPNALTVAAFTDTAGFQYTQAPLSFGLQVSTVPWPATASTMLAGLALLASLAVARCRA